MKKSFLTLVVFSAMLGISGAASAEHHEGGPELEHDEEMRERMKHRKHHRKEKMEKMRKYMMKRVDTNGDGQIDLNEFLTNAEERFNSMDLDGDGFVTAEESREAGKEMRKKHREMRKKMREQHDAELEAEQESEESGS